MSDPLQDAVAGDSIRIDLDGDGRPEEVLAVGGIERSGAFRASDAMPSDTSLLGRGGVLVRSAAGGDTEWRGFRHEEYAPFLLRFADIDGDGETEIAAGVYDRGPKTGRGDERGRIRQQLHLFRWSHGRLVPLWFCGRRYTDFQFAPMGGRIRLLELSHARSVFMLRAFHWQGFGWWQDASVDLGADPVKMMTVGANVYLERADGRRVEVGWNDERSELQFVAH